MSTSADGTMQAAGDARAAWQRTGMTLAGRRSDIHLAWLEHLRRDGQTVRIDQLTLEDICARLLSALIQVLDSDQPPGAGALPQAMRDLLAGVSADFAERGLTPSQTAAFIFSLKPRLAEVLADITAEQLLVQQVVDSMGLYSMDAFITRREQIIRRQTQELMDISVPVVPLWEGILSLPIIGTLDSGRAQAITEKLLFEIARTSSRYALLDISGVPTVDTQTAQYLARTVAAARLMGAECVITGIRPAIAQVMVALGVSMSTIETKFSLAEGLRYCFARQGLAVKRLET